MSQTSRCIYSTPWSIQHASIFITNGKITWFFGNWMMWLEIRSPHGPHFGGLWEAVKSMKNHLRRTLGAHMATYEELCYLLAEIEACLNSRPLCALSNDPLNPTYLSPEHFLIAEPLTQLPSVDSTNVDCKRLSGWQTYQRTLLAAMVIRLSTGTWTATTRAEDIP